MNNEPLYTRTVNILVDAYFNDTLVHSNQCACAVGNLVAANIGVNLVKRDGSVFPSHFLNPNYDISDYDDPKNNGAWYKTKFERKYPIGADQIKSTGYSLDEVWSIEKAFETAPKGNSDDEWMFNGLMAVIDTLDQIHQNSDTNLTQTNKQRFARV